MQETREYSKTLCDQRHMDHERYEELRFAQIEKEQGNMGNAIEKIDKRLSEKFDDDAKVTRMILFAVLGTFATAIIGVVSNILLKIMHI